MEEKRLFDKKFLNINFTIFTIVLLVFLTYTFVKSKGMVPGTECGKMDFSGSYSFDGVTFYNIDENLQLAPTKENMLILKGHFNQDMLDGKPLYLFLQGLKCKMYVNGEEVFSHTKVTEEPWEYIYPIYINSTDEISFVLTTENKYHINMFFERFFDNIYHGSRFDLVAHMIEDDSISVLVCLVITVLGFGMLIYRISYGLDSGSDVEGMLSCGMLLLTGGVVGFVDYKYATLLFNNSFFIKQLDQLNQAMMAMYLISYMKKYMYKENSRKLNDFLVVVMSVLIVIFMIKNMILPSENQYNPAFVCLMGMVVVLLVFELIELYRNSREKNKKLRVAFESLLVLVVAFIIEMAYFLLTGTYFTKLFEAALFLFATLHYYLLFSNNLDNYKKARKTTELEYELSQNKIKLVMSQIQPHFLFNAIATIRAMCIKNPEEARNGLDYFAKYLRANMDSLGQDGCIPFSKELDHTKSYLYIEKLRFGEMLEIQYDIQADDFMVPPLTLQTMAENSVKHGLLAQKEGGILKISTSETDEVYEIKVEDNGVGFDLTRPLDEGRSHVGIQNTRQRVAAMCGGTLNIASKAGAGTTVTILIPKNFKGI